jgi:ferredoxin
MDGHFQISVDGFGQSFPCRSDERVLIAMERLGRRDIPVGCRGGGCGACKVLVIEGRYHTGKMSRQQVSEAEAAQGYALACRLYPNTDLKLRPVGTVMPVRRG